eukprot:GDKJ01003208.1.p1 GENE.GDKJ01003208.1~~GDKJ01003208.1.p1  ORF type:complete len:577 (+),score=146.73 GDKJ01003208.1:26-1756(+)
MWNWPNVTSLEQEEKALLDESLEWLNRGDEMNHNQIKWKKEKVYIGDKEFLNTITYYSSLVYKESDSLVQGVQMILCPGYGGGVAQYARTAADYCNRHPDRTVSIIDWIGIGLSYHHPEGMRIDREDDTCLDPFIQSLEQWRVARGVKTLDLVGHSMGGYFCARYSILYPNNVNRLVLASCVGIPRRPEVVKDRFEDANLISKTIGRTALQLVAKSSATPFTFLRAAGPLGHILVKKLVMERFATKCTESLPARFGDYIYHYNGLPSCGEQIVLVALDAQAYARRPLLDLLENLTGEHFPPVCFVHGEYDWVFPEPSLTLIKKDPSRRTIYFVPSCGHQIFTENSRGFTEAMEFAIMQPLGARQPNPPPMRSPPLVSFVAGYKGNRPAPVSPLMDHAPVPLLPISISRPNITAIVPSAIQSAEKMGELNNLDFLPSPVSSLSSSEVENNEEEDEERLREALVAFEGCLPSELAVCAIQEKLMQEATNMSNSKTEKCEKDHIGAFLGGVSLANLHDGGASSPNIFGSSKDIILAANHAADMMTEVPGEDGSDRENGFENSHSPQNQHVAEKFLHNVL